MKTLRISDIGHRNRGILGKAKEDETTRRQRMSRTILTRILNEMHVALNQPYLEQLTFKLFIDPYYPSISICGYESSNDDFPLQKGKVGH